MVPPTPHNHVLCLLCAAPLTDILSLPAGQSKDCWHTEHGDMLNMHSVRVVAVREVADVLG
jgi:hypothetical protein